MSPFTVSNSLCASCNFEVAFRVKKKHYTYNTISWFPGETSREIQNYYFLTESPFLRFFQYHLHHYHIWLCFKDRNFHFTTLWSWIYSQFSQRRGLYIHNLLSNQWLSDIFTTVFHQRFPPVRTRPCVKFAVGEINIIRIAGKKIFFSAFFSWAETAPPGKLDAN